MSETPEGIHRGIRRDRVRELSDCFAFHLERWARGRTPLWARHSCDPQDVVQTTLADFAQREALGQSAGDGSPLADIRRLLYDNMLARIQKARDGAPAELKHHLRQTASQSLRDSLLETELLRRYESALNRLSTADRDAVIARAELGLPWSDVIGLLGKPGSAAARVMVSRALIRLAREMSHDRNG